MIQKPIVIALFFLVSMLASGQTNTFQNTQAIVTPGGGVGYDTEGYDIVQIDYELPFDKKGFSKIKRKLNLPKETPVNDSPDFPNVKVIEHSFVKNEITYSFVYYLSVPRWQNVRVVSFATSCSRLPEVEKEFYKEIFNRTLPKSIYTPFKVDTILFAGRPIPLGPACQWMNTRNLQCPNYGQMNWSEFTDSVRAKQALDNQKIENANLENFRITKETEVTVIFEGQEVKAIRRTMVADVPQLFMGGSNVLIMYYVLAKVRGRYVSCALSHYTDDVGAKQNKLPPLLAQVMQLKE